MALSIDTEHFKAKQKADGWDISMDIEGAEPNLTSGSYTLLVRFTKGDGTSISTTASVTIPS